MRNYRYKAINGSGESVHGDMLSINLDTLDLRLEDMGLTMIFAKEKGNIQLFKKGGFKRRDLIDFFMEIRTMYKAGIPIFEAINSTTPEIENDKLRNIFTEVSYNMSSGVGLSTSLTNFPKHFDEMTISVIKIGEDTGMLDKSLDFITEYYEWYDDLVSKVKQAAVEPIVLLSGIFIFVGIIFGFVLPKFLTMIQRLNVDLPLPTVIMIHVSDFLNNYWALVISFIVGAIFSFIYFMRGSPSFKLWVHSKIIRIPIFGNVIKMIHLSGFFHNLVMQINSGITIIDALETSSRSANNKFIEKTILNIRESIIKGESITESFKREPEVFNNMTVRMISAGEETGSLTDTLKHIYEHYDKLVPRKIELAMSIFNPIVMMALASIVMLLALSIFMPMMGLMDNFS